MDYDPMLAAMLSQPWSNNACRGYVIYAMENCGFSPNDIRRVVAELYEVFDFRSLEEAQQHFAPIPELTDRKVSRKMEREGAELWNRK